MAPPTSPHGHRAVRRNRSTISVDAAIGHAEGARYGIDVDQSPVVSVDDMPLRGRPMCAGISATKEDPGTQVIGASTGSVGGPAGTPLPELPRAPGPVATFPRRSDLGNVFLEAHGS